MNDHPDSARLSVEQERHVDAVCERFEKAVRAGEAADIASIVAAEDPAIRPRLEAELSALARELSTPPEPAPRAAPGIPERIDDYRILAKIGEGGMGTVFEAVHETTRRRVALKVVRSDLTSDQVRRRFEREARLLGHLHHPGIAQIHDAGLSDPGDGGRPLPYLVMELVRGRPLTAHADGRRLDVRQRLALVRRICDAVQHAHDQGIVHRDLKPANILVHEPPTTTASLSDSWAAGVGMPKVLDFGIARMLEDGMEASLRTQTGQLVGTIAYMSPEQLDGHGDDIDGRTDVYALGVMLYELLAHRLPHDLTGLSVPAAIARLRDEDPAPLGRLDTALTGDVEIIVAKALEKDRTRRYATAAALAADLQRHLDDVPISARAPDAIDRLAKFARRNRGLFQGIVAAVAILVISLVVVSWLALEQSRLRVAAEDARDDAEQRRRIAAATADFLDDMLSQANLDRAGNRRDTLLFDVLVAAAEGIDEAFPDDPASRAAVRRTLGMAFLSQAEADRALYQVESARREIHAAHGAHSREAALVENDVGRALEELERFDESEAAYRRSVELGRRLGLDAEVVTQSLHNLASVLERVGRVDEALELHRQSLELSERHHGTASAEAALSHNNLGTLLEYTGDFDTAETHYHRALEIRRSLYDGPHRHIANSLNNLAVLHHRNRDYAAAEALHREALAMREVLFDADHPDVAGSRAALAGIAYKHLDLETAERLYREALAPMRSRLGPDHTLTLSTGVNLSLVLSDQGKLDDAYELLRPAVDTFRERFGPRHGNTLWAARTLALCELDRGHPDAAFEIQREVTATCREDFGNHTSTAHAVLILARIELARGHDDTALDLHREAAAIAERAVGRTHATTMRCRFQLAQQLERCGRNAEAHEVARTLLEDLDSGATEAAPPRAEVEALASRTHPSNH